MLLTPLKGQKLHLEKLRRRNAAAEALTASWEDLGGGRGHRPLQTLSAAVPGLLLRSSPLQSNMQRPGKVSPEEECLAILIINFGNDLPSFCCAQG